MIELNNIEDIACALSKLTDLSRVDYNKALSKACIVVENSAKAKAPVNKGELRSSITHEVTESGECIVYTNQLYAPYVEYGTGLFAEAGNGRQEAWSYQDAKGKWHTTLGAPPQPFLRPALEENRDKILQLINDEISKELENNAK